MRQLGLSPVSWRHLQDVLRGDDEDETLEDLVQREIRDVLQAAAQDEMKPGAQLAALKTWWPCSSWSTLVTAHGQGRMQCLYVTQTPPVLALRRRAQAREPCSSSRAAHV